MPTINLRGISTKKLISVLAVIILLAVLVFPHPARAGAIADFLGFNFTGSTLGAIVHGVTTLILNFVQTAISFFANLFDKFIRWQTDNAIYGVVVVDQSWTIIRNFVNMFFILILIIMAFGTIFDIKKYTWREMLAPFLISALLVNFSLTIGQYIIAVTNGLSGVFLKQIVDVSGTFAQGFNIVGTATSGSTDLISGVTKIIITEIFAIIFLTVVMLAFAAAAIFSLVRIFMLWFLLIISPIAWIGYSLPNLRGQTWSEWWKQFFCWCFFLPYYLFFVMFAVIFVKNRGTIPPIPGSDKTAGMTGTDFLFYALSLIFLIGGLVIARKMACASGSGIKNVFGKIETGVRRYAPGARYVRAIGAGVTATAKRVEEEGLPKLGGLYEGTRVEKQRAARFGERFQQILGFRESFAAQKEFVNNSNKEYEAIKQQHEMGRIDVTAIRQGVAKYRASDPKGFAFRKMLGEVGQLDTVTTRDTLVALANNPFASTDFIKNSSEKGKLSELPASEIRAMAAAEGIYANVQTNIAARKQLYRHVQANASVASGLSQDQFDNAMSMFGGPTTAEGTAFLKEVGKIRPDLAATFVENYERAHPPPGRPAKLRLDVMASNITSAKDVGSMHVNVWNDPVFRQALFNEFRSRSGRGTNALRNYLTNLQESIRESADSIARKTDKQALVNAFIASVRAIPPATPLTTTFSPPAEPAIP